MCRAGAWCASTTPERTPPCWCGPWRRPPAPPAEAPAAETLPAIGAAQPVDPIGVRATGPDASDLPEIEPAESVLQEEASEVPDTRQPWPALAMPAPSIAAGFAEADLAFVRAPATPTEQAPDGLAELLFEATMEITAADDPQEAADAALSILLQHVQAESAAVLFAGINDVGLRFLAVRGPSSQDLPDVEIPFDQGIAGFSHTRAADLIVHNAAEDPRHLGEIDARTGYRTGAMLVAALRDNEGDVHGCIELMNPPGRFWPWQLDATRSVARTLADFLGRRA